MEVHLLSATALFKLQGATSNLWQVWQALLQSATGITKCWQYKHATENCAQTYFHLFNVLTDIVAAPQTTKRWSESE